MRRQHFCRTTGTRRARATDITLRLALGLLTLVFAGLAASAQDWPDAGSKSAAAATGSAASAASAADSAPTAITGRVLDGNGEPLAGASLRLETLRSSSSRAAAANGRGGARQGSGRGFSRNVYAESDADGSFSLTPSGDGSFLLEVTHSGYRTYRTVVAAASAATPQFVIMTRGAQPTRVAWIGSLGEGLSRASETRMPTMIFMTMDGERANDYMAAVTYRDAGIVELAAHVHPVLSTSFTHTSVEGAECPKYGSVTCAEHQDVEARVTSTFFGQGQSIDVPQHLFLAPGGGLLDRRRFQISTATLRNMMIRAIRAVDPQRAADVAGEYYADIRQQLERGNAVTRAAALDGLLMLADSGDEIARTALLDIDPARLSSDQEGALLDSVIANPDSSMIDGIARLICTGGEDFRAAAMQRLRDSGAGAGAGETDTEDAGSATDRTNAIRQAILVRSLALAGDAALRVEIETALGVTRRGGKLQFAADLSERDQRSIAFALARHADPAALPILEGIIASPPNMTLLADAGIALLRYPTSTALSIFERELARGGADRAVIARLIGELGDPRGADSLMGALRDSSIALRTAASRALGFIGYRDAVPALTELTENTSIDNSIRVAAAAALVDLGSTNGIRPLIEYVENPVLGGAAREALQHAHATTAPRTSSEWRRWWSEQRGGE